MRILAIHKIQFVILYTKHHARIIFFITIKCSIISALFVSIATRGKICTVELVSLRRHALHDYVNFIYFVLWIKCHFNINILFYSIIILSCDLWFFNIKI